MSDFDPVRGLTGDYSGTCVVCGQPTDTGLAFEGSAEFYIAGLVTLGVPMDQATTMVTTLRTGRPGYPPAGVDQWTVRVCTPDALKAGFVAPGLLVAGSPLPGYSEGV